MPECLERLQGGGSRERRSSWESRARSRRCPACHRKCRPRRRRWRCHIEVVDVRLVREWKIRLAATYEPDPSWRRGERHNDLVAELRWSRDLTGGSRAWVEHHQGAHSVVREDDRSVPCAGRLREPRRPGQRGRRPGSCDGVKNIDNVGRRRARELLHAACEDGVAADGGRAHPGTSLR